MAAIVTLGSLIWIAILKCITAIGVQHMPSRMATGCIPPVHLGKADHLKGTSARCITACEASFAAPAREEAIQR